VDIENEIFHFFNIKSFPEVKSAFSSIEVLDKIKELDIHLKSKPIDEIFMVKLKILIEALLDTETFDISENIEDLNIDNELIKNICFIKFLNRIEEIKLKEDKNDRDKYTNEAYEDEIFFCNKVLNKKKSKNNSESKGSQKNFFDQVDLKNPHVIKDILNLIKKRLEANPLDYKSLKGFRKDIKKINLPKDIVVNNKNKEELKNEINTFKSALTKYLGDSKDIYFLKLMRDLQYEYCIFKVENKNLVSYNCSSLDKSNTEEGIRKYILNKNDHLSNSSNKDYLKNLDDLNEEEDHLLENVN